METIDNVFCLDLEFVRGLHSTLLPRLGQVISGQSVKDSLSSPMGFKIVLLGTGSGLTLALALSICLPGGLGGEL